MKKFRLMIIMGDKAWTLAALHLACAVSRRGETELLLIKMVPVRHPALLGTEAGFVDFAAKDGLALAEMGATAEDYGVSVNVHLFQYANYWPGIVDAAAQLGATAVIARIPPSSFPYWQELRLRWLRLQLGRQHQIFFPLDDLQPSLVWTPSLTLQNDMARLLEQYRLNTFSTSPDTP